MDEGMQRAIQSMPGVVPESPHIAYEQRRCNRCGIHAPRISQAQATRTYRRWWEPLCAEHEADRERDE